MEKIVILAGRDRVTLTGKGLEPLLAAIDSEQPIWVSETPELREAELETSIYSIEIEPCKAMDCPLISKFESRRDERDIYPLISITQKHLDYGKYERSFK